MELGKGFCFEARQKRITVNNQHYYIDLLFYHRILKCHVLIDLKTREFTHTDAGQMNFYLNYMQDNEMEKGDNPPVGIVLCTHDQTAEVKYAVGGLDNKMFVSRYKLQLPTEKELKNFIRKDIKTLEVWVPFLIFDAESPALNGPYLVYTAPHSALGMMTPAEFFKLKLAA